MIMGNPWVHVAILSTSERKFFNQELRNSGTNNIKK